MSILGAILITLASIFGVALTLLTLPGIWFALLIALLCEWLIGGPPMFSVWTLGAGVALGVAGELIELFASAAGATRFGGGRSGAIGSIIGAFFGALAGSIVMPVIGTIAGAVAGAGAGAIALERKFGRRTWRDSARVGTGAMAGRFVATLVKGAIAVAVAVLLSVAAFVP